MIRVKLLVGALLLAITAGAAAQMTTAERRALKTPLPHYPQKALRNRLEGDVQVCYVVDVNGHIHRPRVQSTSHRWFNRAAIRAARGLRYEPAPPGAANSRTNLCSTFRFRLNRESDAPAS